MRRISRRLAQKRPQIGAEFFECVCGNLRPFLRQSAGNNKYAKHGRSKGESDKTAGSPDSSLLKGNNLTPKWILLKTESRQGLERVWDFLLAAKTRAFFDSFCVFEGA